MSDKLEEAIFAAGCFWGIEAHFSELRGVLETEVGYIGGDKESPSYEEVCTGRTGHAEAVRVRFDPREISYEVLLENFWACHDPTQKDRQGPDVGTQYRTAIFPCSSAQESAARASLEAEESSGKYGAPIATQIESAGRFWLAEEYHQQYEKKRRVRIFGKTG